jgi:hypothetical protein
MKTEATQSVSSLEREIITAVVILYVMICAIMLAIHYLQPEGQETKTSSPSPSHEYFREETTRGKTEPTVR